jgi:hypothetical protein
MRIKTYLYKFENALRAILRARPVYPSHFSPEALHSLLKGRGYKHNPRPVVQAFLLWHNLHIPVDQKNQMDHPWKERILSVEWRTKGQCDVKVHDQKKTVDYADYKMGLSTSLR